MSGPDFGALGEEAELVEVEPEAKQEILENKDVSTWTTSWIFSEEKYLGNFACLFFLRELSKLWFEMWKN